MTIPRSGFSDVDHTADPAAFVRFLDQRSATPFFIDNRAARLARLQLTPDSRVLEVGCGVGDFTRDLQAAVGSAASAGPTAAVVGLDFSAVMLAIARARTDNAAALPRYCLADASHLPFAPASFDALTAERVLFHLDDPASAVAELARVARPGARVALFEPDWATMAISAGEPDVTRKIISLYVGRLATPDAARALPHMLRAAGFGDVRVEPADHVRTERSDESGGGGLRNVIVAGIASGALTRDEVAAWSTAVREAESAGRYRFSVRFLLITASRPAD
jgi:ubiquinone/menaquinone biosynthesis C-methylase UbiE